MTTVAASNRKDRIIATCHVTRCREERCHVTDNRIDSSSIRLSPSESIKLFIGWLVSMNARAGEWTDDITCRGRGWYPTRYDGQFGDTSQNDVIHAQVNHDKGLKMHKNSTKSTSTKASHHLRIPVLKVCLPFLWLKTNK